jgi:GxxExxY protein
MNGKLTENHLSRMAIGCALKVHSALGPRLLESAYEACLHHELLNAGLLVSTQKPLPIIYESVRLQCGYGVDLMVENKLIVEVKSVESLADIHLAQILTYLRLADLRLGLLMNFNVLHLKDGIRRVVNNL